ncbi:MAG: hypothetical protein DRR08_23120 [Candidatus Parabeggiatoa sp. nov. 2]|nr:MAG: hypothetical protein B6247_27245 [Beggiatoa sp. 4572_84]RKZ55872.1 MAG: hypothetical protein DRR08_23120 [Gammaproteobacteria bacterium]
MLNKISESTLELKKKTIMKLKNFSKEAKKLVSIARTADLKKTAIPFYDILPSWCFPERHLRFKAYCVGMGKTGTSSLHVTFSNQYRSAHYAEDRFVINRILAFSNGKINQTEFTRYVKHRDRRLGLEMDSSPLNYHLIDILVSEFSEAKFIFTLRDCYSWLDSFINHSLTYPQIYNTWFRHHNVKLEELHFRSNKFKHAKEEQVLADNGLYTLEGYFSYWKEHNSKVLATVPPERLLVVKTSQINQNINRIETFLGIMPGSLPTQVRVNVGKKKFNLLSKIDKRFLEEKAEAHCKELMDEYFSDVKGFNF